MEIGPVSNRPAGQKTEGTGSPRQDGAPPDKVQRPPIADRAEISVEARLRLAEMADRERLREQQGPGPVAADNLTNEERLEIIKKRVASGYYNQPQVRARIVEKLIDDLNK